MCPGLGEWWSHKGVFNLQNLVYMLKLCLGFLVDTLLFCVKWLARLRTFIYDDILVLVSEFVEVVILFQWWSVPTTTDNCGHIPDCSNWPTGVAFIKCDILRNEI